MPTKKQMFLRPFYEDEEGYNVRGSAMAGTGNNFHKPFTGEHIGHLKWDEEKGDFKLVLSSEQNPEVCDATEVDSSTEAGNKNNT